MLAHCLCSSVRARALSVSSILFTIRHACVDTQEAAAAAAAVAANAAVKQRSHQILFMFSTNSTHTHTHAHSITH